jgi:hypothetical protein
MLHQIQDDESDGVVDPEAATGHGHLYPYAYYLTQIIAFSQQIYGVDEESEARLAAAIKAITNDQVHLSLHRQVLSPTRSMMMALVTGRRGFVVRWGNVVYGCLQVKYVASSNDQLALPIEQCERLSPSVMRDAFFIL